jgi:hypothetical protein
MIPTELTEECGPSWDNSEEICRRPDHPTLFWVQLASGSWIQLSSEETREVVPATQAPLWLMAICWIRQKLQRSAALGATKTQLLNELDLYACGANNQWLRELK